MSDAPTDKALRLPTDQRGPALLRVPENQWFDRKSGRVTARDLADSLIGFANADGGRLVVGLHGGRVEGVNRQGSEKLNALRQAPVHFCTPPIRVKLRHVSCIRSDGENDELLVFDIEAGESVHSNARDEVYLRVGDENRRLTYAQRRELEFDKGQTTYESTALLDGDWAELDESLVGGYAEACEARDPRGLLQARGLITPRGQLTVGSVLLFGIRPQARFPQSLVRVARYRGISRGTGARQALIADVRCEGTLPEQISRAREILLEQIPARTALGRDGRFGPISLVPIDAWVEGLVNAVIHRSYSLAGDHIRIDVFDDRLEIESPGRFPGLVRVDDPARVTRFARNPRIARVCADLRFGVERGEGVRRIFEEMELAGLAAPEYAQTSGSVRLTLTTAAVDLALEVRLPPDGREIVRAMRDLDRASTGGLVRALGMSRPAVLRRLRELERIGVAEWVGESPKDPRAFWRLKT